MPHWGFRMNRRDLPDQLLYAIAHALEADFHPPDAGRLLALGRATAGDADFQAKAQDTRDALADRVGSVLAEASEEAGERPVDAELLAILTAALAAGFDQGR